jgi:tetratricopeptide (TPR) repeat protein
MKRDLSYLTHRFAGAAALAALAGLSACTASGGGSANTDVGSAEPVGPVVPPTDGARLYPGFDNYERPASAAAQLARPFVEHGLQWLFGFNDDEAIRCFLRAAELDSECAVAWWGVAYANGNNINDPVFSEREARDAYDAIQRALALREHATPVDRALIDALAQRYAWPAPADLRPLEEAYCAAMAGVWKAFPQDADVAVLYAESMMNLQPWAYWTREGEPKGRATEIVATLERALELDPDHPGALHYYIHALEASKQPERAEQAAERLLDVVPGSSHLVHMPSHIFTRVGRYSDAADSNERAVAVDREYLANAPEQDYYGLYIAHNLHFLTYATMMEGRFDAAVAAAKGLETQVPATFMERYPGVADGWFAALPHVLVRFGKWSAILELEEYPEGRPISRAMRRYARSIANSARGDTAAAREEMAAFEAEAARVPIEWTIGMNPAHAVFPMARKMMLGELAFREGNHELAFASLREAAQIEDALLYDEPPGWLQPVRHALGALLMAAGRYAEAEEVYSEDLERNPNNGWSLLGLEKSRRMQGETDGLDDLIRRRSKAWARADVAPTSSCYCEPGAVTLEP